MSTLAMTHTLAALFVPIGIAGTVIAVLCALVAAIAVSCRAAGLAGGAAGVWIVGALLSWASSFAHLWTPLFVSLGALSAALVVGSLMRGLIASASAVHKRHTPAPAARMQEPRTHVPQPQPTRTAAVQARTVASATGIRAA